ncbi:hypothetical protein [Paludisphaera mucosa]|uniref:Uncharacterized protein n=1 Tax=Paludisphaera mucosa TaxID=3030827 RepID=A0ABT6FHZ2_9BACT|nr:hypothetical protein [Paludisphaera mucosa]MDG3007106.1 hypothetical protein [Paludisphaera mucosa]
MRRLLLVAFGVSIGLISSPRDARSQMMYPGGYGGYGMSQWGADPGAGYMAGLGSYARGQGVYAVEKAKADAINLDTMIKWNKALRVRQRALREDQRKEDARREAAREARVENREFLDGTTLNDVLMQILDSDPGVAKSARVKAPLSAAAIREIPFEWDSEAVTICIDQMTGAGSLPPLLMDPRYLAERQALRDAVEPALREDAKGEVSAETRRRIVDAVAAFRGSFVKNASDFAPDFQEAQDYFTTLASLTRLLNDPSLKAFLAQLDDGRERTVGDLVAFMNSFNLRFGAPTSERQIEIYRRLLPALKQIRDASVAATTPPASAPDRTGADLQTAAKAAFKGMSWDQLEAHSRAK